MIVRELIKADPYSVVIADPPWSYHDAPPDYEAQCPVLQGGGVAPLDEDSAGHMAKLREYAAIVHSVSPRVPM